MKKLIRFSIEPGPPAVFVKTYSDGTTDRVTVNNQAEYKEQEELCIAEMMSPLKHN
ncbi:hypothetical protein SSBR45G_55300 [Bradyrhizobium sp. SSBR45G]|uniref:hypothetical protein n=1 Tax=unclassified Bradyrhizobium TaxID=2631580 RepID=UPI002342AD0D|nr:MULTISPECIES: hypothetical protein [unclassified Bradyrhizobium]GLH80621.1 hypothetical protein SSBR45G_55300 [Bradyrhizobium sp. SSBR45G]GLH85827.1 hypothetical protein SSBR45R_32870 [Bradyrhizobium sp. SSBR45R]